MIAQDRIQAMSSQDMMMMGIESLAYVKPTVIDGQMIFQIFAANGAEIGAMPSRDVAFAAVRQQGLEPVSVH